MMEQLSEKRIAGLDEEDGNAAPNITDKNPRKSRKHDAYADEAMTAFVWHEGEIYQLDDATNRRLLRRIDMNLMPVRIAHKL